jgi:hypothetical protein
MKCLRCITNRLLDIIHIAEDIIFYIRHRYYIGDIWDLDTAIAKFVLKRLKVFRNSSISHPTTMTMEEWVAVIDELIWTFEWQLDVESGLPNTDADNWQEINSENWNRFHNGMQLFANHYRNLWT